MIQYVYVRDVAQRKVDGKWEKTRSRSLAEWSAKTRAILVPDTGRALPPEITTFCYKLPDGGRVDAVVTDNKSIQARAAMRRVAASLSEYMRTGKTPTGPKARVMVNILRRALGISPIKPKPTKSARAAQRSKAKVARK